MHEIKSPFLILMEEQSYLAQSLESAFEKTKCQSKNCNDSRSQQHCHLGKTKWLPDLHKPGAFKKSGQRKSNG